MPSEARTPAAAKFLQKATAIGDPDLTVREWGAYLIQQPDGSIVVGPIIQGSAFAAGGGTGSTPLTLDGIDPATVVGSVHSHNAGNHLPSTAPAGQASDVSHLAGMEALMNHHRGPGAGAGARMYIIAQTTGPAGHQPYNKINVYTPATIGLSTTPPFKVGPEVNPEALTCPLN